jgi:hypothetical protein
MKLRVGDGARFVVVAIGICMLSLALDLILELNNYYYYVPKLIRKLFLIFLLI